MPLTSLERKALETAAKTYDTQNLHAVLREAQDRLKRKLNLMLPALDEVNRQLLLDTVDEKGEAMEDYFRANREGHAWLMSVLDQPAA